MFDEGFWWLLLTAFAVTARCCSRPNSDKLWVQVPYHPLASLQRLVFFGLCSSLKISWNVKCLQVPGISTLSLSLWAAANGFSAGAPVTSQAPSFFVEWRGSPVHCGRLSSNPGIFIILMLQFAPNYTLRPRLHAPQKLCPQTCQIISSALSPPKMIIGLRGDDGNSKTWAVIYNMVKRTE